MIVVHIFYSNPIIDTNFRLLLMSTHKRTVVDCSPNRKMICSNYQESA